MSAVMKAREVRLRPMSAADLVTVMRVERAGYRHPWSEGIFNDCLQAGHLCWMAELDGEVVGHGVMMVAAGEAHILNVCVHPDHQGRGVGRRILNHLLHLARRRDADMALLEVRPSNTAAVALYDSLGFNEIGRRPNYYPARNGREDALMMARTLIEGEGHFGEWE
ncbi:ribosomal protein S18-alanine N-acetyltransferase [Endothiovibrio diazotrophicus]